MLFTAQYRWNKPIRLHYLYEFFVKPLHHQPDIESYIREKHTEMLYFYKLSFSRWITVTWWMQASTTTECHAHFFARTVSQKKSMENLWLGIFQQPNTIYSLPRVKSLMTEMWRTMTKIRTPHYNQSTLQIKQYLMVRMFFSSQID